MFSFFFIFIVVVSFFIFFFKQKTAYEMRISDWSSDVCSSDLGSEVPSRGALRQEERPMNTIDHRAYFSRRAAQERRLADAAADCTARHAHREMARCYADLALDRKSVVTGKSEYVRIAIGGRRILKKNNYQEHCISSKTCEKQYEQNQRI